MTDIAPNLKTGTRLHLTGIGGLYTSPDSESRLLKVLEPPAGIWSEQRLREEMDAFLLRAKTQRLVGKKATHWAVIHQISALSDTVNGTGYSPRGAYVLMDRYERSAQSLIDGHVYVTNDDLRNLFRGVLKGLVELQETLARPHGRIKATNILLGDTVPLATAKVYLTDPAADGALPRNKEAATKKDAADLGRLLYELVMQRPYTGGTVGPSPEWSRLGPNGEDWRTLCGSWLEGVNPADRDWPAVVLRIETWTKQPKKSKLPLIAAGILVIIAAGGVTAFILTRPPKIDFDQPRWEKLCLAYHEWFGDFVDKLSDDQQKAKFSAAPYPTEVVALLQKAGRDLDKYEPRKIAKKAQAPTELAANPSDDAKKGYGPYYTKQGDELIDAIASALTPAHWSTLAQLQQTASTYEKRGWTAPAEGIRSVISGVHPPEIASQPADIAVRIKDTPVLDVSMRIEQVVSAQKTVNTAEAAWTQIQQTVATFPSTQIPLIQAFGKFAESYPQKLLPTGPDTNAGALATVDALGKSFVDIQSVAQRLAKTLQPTGPGIQYDELANDPAAQLPAGKTPTIADYEKLADAVPMYVKLAEDPRQAVSWQNQLDDVDKGMIGVISEANKTDEHLPQLIQQRAALGRDVAAMQKIAPIEKNRETLISLVNQNKTTLDKLTDEGNTWSAPYKIDPVAYLAQQRDLLKTSPLAKGTPIVYTQWSKAQQTLLDDATKDPAALKNYKVFRSVDGRFKAIAKIYADFDNVRLPRDVPGLSSIQGTDWRHTIATRIATTYREQALTDLMTNPALKFDNGVPLVDDAAYKSFEADRMSQFEKSRTDAVDLIADYTRIAGALDGLTLVASDGGDGAQWRTLAEKWKGSPSLLMKDTEAVTSLKPINDRVSGVESLDSITDYREIVSRSSSSFGEILLTTWRKLGTVGITETDPVLNDEAALETKLQQALAAGQKSTVVASARAAAIQQELAVARPIRWHRYAAIAKTPAAIQTALDAKQTFGVTLNPTTDPTLVYDDNLYTLRKAYDKGAPESELRTLAQRFITQTQTLPTTVSSDASVAGLMARLAKPLSQNEQDVSAAGAGPKLAGWEQDQNPSSDVRTFYWPSKANPRHTLEFARLSAGGKTVYLCTTELSLGVFADAMATAGKLSDLDDAAKPSDKAHWFKTGNDVWDGPRVWKVAGGKFTTNDSWLFTIPQMGNNLAAYYPAGKAANPPTLDDPMQDITPWSAMYAARLLGCRLPTSTEWTTAYDRWEAKATTRDAWSLRGIAWSAQQAHAKSQATNGMPYPDAGIFIPPDALFSGITADAAKAWGNTELTKIAPNRISTAAGDYTGGVIWFREVGHQPGVAAPNIGNGAMHDLVGNVAEYTFDADTATAIIKDAKPTVAAVDTTIATNKDKLFVIGGSSLSPPVTPEVVPFTQKAPVDPDFAQTASGYADVGLRLCYTAPIDTVGDVLAAEFKAPSYLPTAR